MRNTLVGLLTAVSMVAVSACSAGGTGGRSAAGNGEGEAVVPPAQAGNAANPPTVQETIGQPSTTEKKTVVFSTFFPSEFLNEAKRKYEAKHPNITIDLRYVDSDNKHLEENLEKFVKTTGTAMLSGKGPDLLEMDQLPSGSYVGKKLLANLGDLMDKDPSFRKENYFSNVLDGMKVNGGIYGMPIGFILYGFMGNKTLIENSGVPFDDSGWTWSEFAGVAKELAKKADPDHKFALGGMPPEYMLANFVNAQYATFIDQPNRRANFESAAFSDLLQQVKSLYDARLVNEQARFSIFRETTIVSPSDYIREIRQSEFMPNKMDYKSKLYVMPHADGQKPGSFFRTYQTIGLNEKSAVKAEAWDFLKFLLSDEVQAKADGAGFPLNKASYQNKVQALLQKGKVESDQPIGPMKGQSFDITQNDIDDLDKFVNGAIYPVQFKPSKIDEIVREDSKAYFTGQKTPEAVAKLIQNRITTVLNE
ncbi:ABC transporter substrate-binding protein [Paenibacillus hodogayensis]|uniref:ABC transporter substrate-binding protein n=1 Tax=Paenibacillus hodogayensis TaxID=279208 RepID=A0ABV5W4C6_9BACL